MNTLEARIPQTSAVSTTATVRLSVVKYFCNKLIKKWG
jgi:hypothetical protein